tara:strand:+ start:270 stop:476 length:207 start_codon:yes stop_codon:yes gene_type:complete
MNNTELTLDQLSEIAGGPAYGMDTSSFTSTKLENGTGLHDSVHCFRGKQARRLETRLAGSADPGGDDV